MKSMELLNNESEIIRGIAHQSNYSTELLFHSINVAQLSKKIGESLGLTTAELDDLFFLGLMHDIGKAYIPDKILYKKSKLNPSEWQVMKTHSIHSEEILTNSACINFDKTKANDYGVIVRGHHEKYWGGGYPDNLKGEEIHFMSRIITIADIYDAIKSPRIYRPYSLVNPINILSDETEITIDPYIFKHAITVIKNVD